MNIDRRVYILIVMYVDASMYLHRPLHLRSRMYIRNCTNTAVLVMLSEALPCRGWWFGQEVGGDQVRRFGNRVWCGNYPESMCRW